MKFATLASSALATVLIAGSALALAPTDENPNVPQRDYQTGVVTAQPTTGEAVSATAGTDLSLEAQGEANQYVFSDNTADTSVRSPEANYR